MRVRHVVERENVDPRGLVRDPAAIRHGLIVGRCVGALAGPIDSATHLNLDFPDHSIGDCIVVEQFAIGAAVLLDGDRFTTARVAANAFMRRGPVDVGARRSNWLKLLDRKAGAG